MYSTALTSFCEFVKILSSFTISMPTKNFLLSNRKIRRHKLKSVGSDSDQLELNLFWIALRRTQRCPGKPLKGQCHEIFNASFLQRFRDISSFGKRFRGHGNILGKEFNIYKLYFSPDCSFKICKKYLKVGVRVVIVVSA